MAIRSAGIGYVAAWGAWLHPFAFVAYVLRALILGIVGAGLFGYRLPLIDSTRAATIAVIVIITVKLAITQLHGLMA